MYNPQFELQEKKGTIFDVDLDIVRTNRIYSTLFRLSEESVGFLNSGNLKDFSFATDRMRPMLSYINDNSLLISKHLSEGAIKNEKFSILEQEIDASEVKEHEIIAVTSLIEEKARLAEERNQMKKNE